MSASPRRFAALAAAANLSLGLCACGSSQAPLSSPLDAPGTAAKKTLEPIELREVPIPADVLGMSEPQWAEDNRHLVAAFVPRSTGARLPGELALIEPSTGALRCLTCGTPVADMAERPNLGKPQVVGDGRRVLFRTGARPDADGGNPLDLFSGDAEFFRYYFLECEPSVVQCDTARIVPIRLPSEGPLALTQNREARISPDTNWFAWTEVKNDGTRMTLGRLRREADHYTLDDLWVINPAFDLSRASSDDWRLAMPLYEFKNFADGGRAAYYASFHDAQNYDVWRVDLATGERWRVTTDIEWNEGTVESPDGTSFVNGSSRGRKRMAPYALVPRPPFVDFGVYILTGRYSLGGQNRRCLLEPWLLDADGQSGEYFGQPINPENEPGWGSHGPGDWSPDGTRYSFWERDYRDGADPESRAIVATLPARSPSPARQPPYTPRPVWATPRDAWRGALNRIGVFLIPGKQSGTALLTLTGLNANTTVASVVYANYSDDGAQVLDGIESSINPFTLLSGSWTANLRLSGAHSGSLDAEVFSVQKQLYGRVRSTYDDVEIQGIPDAQCEPDALPAPQLQITREADDQGMRVFRITARPIGDDTDRPVRHARVTAGDVVAYSDSTGRVRLPRDAMSTVTAEAGGFRQVSGSF